MKNIVFFDNADGVRCGGHGLMDALGSDLAVVVA